MLENEDDTLSLALGQAFRRIVFLNVILRTTAGLILFPVQIILIFQGGNPGAVA